MKKSLLFTPLAAVVFVLGTSLSAHAASYVFDFNSLASGASNTQIQTYLNSVLGAGAVTVSAGAVADAEYNGDGHVVGSTVVGSTSRTLGTSDGNLATRSAPCTVTGCAGSNLDTFIRNVSGIPSWDFTFNNGIVVDSVSFDYEIFPDASCLTMTCGSLPDFIFTTNVATQFHYYGAAPAANLRSIASGSGSELTPQLIGVTPTFSGLNATTLTFADWPAAIAIDNLNITWHNTTTSAVPEPGTMLLLGSGLAAAYVRSKKRKAA